MGLKFWLSLLHILAFIICLNNISVNGDSKENIAYIMTMYNASNKSTNISVGILLLQSGGLWSAIGEINFWAMWGINDVNGQTDILPDHRLVPYYKDTAGSEKRAMFRAMDLSGSYSFFLFAFYFFRYL